MSTTEPPAPEPEPQRGIETEKSAEVTTEEGTQITHAEQTGVEFPSDETEAAPPEDA